MNLRPLAAAVVHALAPGPCWILSPYSARWTFLAGQLRPRQSAISRRRRRAAVVNDTRQNRQPKLSAGRGISIDT
jgi:hypothetical protein